MTRPLLTPQLTADDFRSFYWLKAELLVFCREHGLSTSGSKADLTERIALFLDTRQRPVRVPTTRRTSGDPLPQTLTRDTAIGLNWRCSERLRAFFLQEIGPYFHFNGVMRDFIRQGTGQTLGAAIEAWQADRAAPRVETDIAPQFEYNRHMRDFFKAHPDRTRQDAIAAWQANRARRKSVQEQ
ncbi:MAG: cytoplasmic protein [Chloroflexi bacterium]|nr:cytoplasmic protein [Chloroflexota bacterium]